MEPTSEQQLKSLLDEGKITQDEYKDLLVAIQNRASTKPTSDISPSKPKSGFGKAAIILMVAGILSLVVPLLLNIMLAALPHQTDIFESDTRQIIMLLRFPFILLAILCFLLAFIFGIIGWKSTSGKIAVFGVPAMVFLILPALFILLMFGSRWESQSEKNRNLELISKTLKVYPLDSMEGVLTHDEVEFDSLISSDGKGSVRITAKTADKTTIRLFETGLLDIEPQLLTYSAKLQTTTPGMKAYLEMWCEFPGKGEFFSRGLDQAILPPSGWAAVQTPFHFEHGQTPSNVKLNLVVEGAGTVWIDDIKLSSTPLN